MRYGENILEVQAAGAWTCPPCRGLCNCSFHRIRRGWAPTGTLYRRAIAEGAAPSYPYQWQNAYKLLDMRELPSMSCPVNLCLSHTSAF